MLLTIAVLIAAGMAVYTVFPLLSAETAGGSLPQDVTPLGDLKRRRLVVYDNMKDLEFEFQSGKVARPDYEALRTNYLGEAASLMAASQDAELLKQDDAVVEREIAARRARRHRQPQVEYKCAACGYENPLPVKFCGECGARIATAPEKKK
jgi:DNA-directed RNA polymerase subunit RPC12/RpoP